MTDTLVMPHNKSIMKFVADAINNRLLSILSNCCCTPSIYVCTENKCVCAATNEEFVLSCMYTHTPAFTHVFTHTHALEHANNNKLLSFEH